MQVPLRGTGGYLDLCFRLHFKTYKKIWPETHCTHDGMNNCFALNASFLLRGTGG